MNSPRGPEHDMTELVDSEIQRREEAVPFGVLNLTPGLMKDQQKKPESGSTSLQSAHHESISSRTSRIVILHAFALWIFELWTRIYKVENGVSTFRRGRQARP